MAGGHADLQLLVAGLEALAPLGVCPFVTTRAPEVAEPVADLLVGGPALRGLMGGHAPPEVLVPRLPELHGAGRYQHERLVRHYPFEQVNEAVNDAVSGQTVKAVLRFPPPGRPAGPATGGAIGT